MKRIPFLIILILLMSPLCVLPLLHPTDGDAAGALRIGDLCMEVYTTDRPDCDCCAPLWGGGIVTARADLTSVQVGDWAVLTLLDGTRLVLECAAILPCIRAGPRLITLQGIFQAEGDIIIYDAFTAYFFVRL